MKSQLRNNILEYVAPASLREVESHLDDIESVFNEIRNCLQDIDLDSLKDEDRNNLEQALSLSKEYETLLF